MNKEKIACYCRVSTKKEEQSLSLENQKKFFEEFAVLNNIQDYELYVDEGISAKSIKKRENFTRMVADAKKGFIKRILVKDISRFARNTYDFLQVTRELKAIGVRVEFVTYNMTTEDSEFTLTVMAAVAQEESASLSRRVRFGKKEGAKKGRVPSRVYGYNKDKRDKYSLTIVPKEADVIKRIFKLYTEEQKSTYQIAAMFNEEGIPTKRGGNFKWSQTVISNILQNRLYIGQVCNGKSETVDFISGDRKEFVESEWIIVERPEFRIVSDEIWRKANEIRGQRTNTFHQFEDDGKTRKKRISIKYPLSNLLVCANDNYSFRRRDRNYPSGNRYLYWTCSKRDLSANICDNKIRIDEEQMHKVITGFLTSLFENQESICKQFREKVSHELNRKYAEKIDIKSLKAEQNKLSLDRDKLMDLFMSNEIDKEYLTQKIQLIEKRLNEIRDSKKIYENQNKAALEIEKCLAKMIDSINMNNDNWLNNAFLKNIFEKFIIHSDGRIEAVIKVEADSNSLIVIPFAEIVNEKEITVPEYSGDI